MISSFSERKQVILGRLAETGRVQVAALAREFGVTPVTVRSDLSALEDEGLLLRLHGGALPAFHPVIVERMRNNREGKAAIARKAAERIADGDTVLITAGTTTALIVRYLLGRRDVHVVTNNTLLLTYARSNPGLRVTLVGGEFRPSEEGLVGPMALQALDQFHVSKAFIGVDGASVKQGFTAHMVESADLVRKMAEHADEVIAISDSQKFGKPGFVRILPFNRVNVLVTDDRLEAEFEGILREAGVEIVKAG